MRDSLRRLLQWRAGNLVTGAASLTLPLGAGLIPFDDFTMIGCFIHGDTSDAACLARRKDF